MKKKLNIFLEVNEKEKKKLDKLPKKHYLKTSDNLIKKAIDEAKEFLKTTKKNDELNAKAKDIRNIGDLLKEMGVEPKKDDTRSISDLLKEMCVEPKKNDKDKKYKSEDELMKKLNSKAEDDRKINEIS